MAVEPATVPIIFSKDRRLTAVFSVSLINVPQMSGDAFAYSMSRT
jgi:hypothetical protein